MKTPRRRGVCMGLVVPAIERMARCVAGLILSRPLTFSKSLDCRTNMTIGRPLRRKRKAYLCAPVPALQRADAAVSDHCAETRRTALPGARARALRIRAARTAAMGGRYRAARERLATSTVKRLVGRKLDTAFDVEETTVFAEKLATHSRRERSIENIKRLAAFVGLETPKGNKNSTPESLARRCYEPKVWRRIIEKNHTRDAENCLREMGYVERRANLYCSRYALDWFKGKQRAQTEWLKSHRVVASDGEQLNLFAVRERSVSNPAIRRAELMTRMKGFEDIAKELGHVAEFVTLTTPSEYHSMLSD